MGLSREELAECIRVLQAIVADRAELTALDGVERRALMEAAGAVARPNVLERRRLQRALRRGDRLEQRTRDDAAAARSGIRSGRSKYFG